MNKNLLVILSVVVCISFTSLDTVNALYKAIENNVDEKDLTPVDITKI